MNPEVEKLIIEATYFLEQNKFEEVIKCCDKVHEIELGKHYALALILKSVALLLLEQREEAVMCTDEAINIYPNNSYVWFSKGLVMGGLGRCEEAIESYNKAIEIEPNNFDAWNNKGSMLGLLKRYNETAECFEKGKRDIYDVLAMSMPNEHKKAIIGIMTDKEDSPFSQIIKKHETTKLIEDYKSLFIDSLMIMNRLQVSKKEAQQGIAHYTSQEALKILLLQEKPSHFRLHSVTLSNDPSEGSTLMDYLYGKGIYTPNDGDNMVLAGSFTFNKDRLNQYRLYGKRDGREATGVSIVFKDSFFAADMKAPTSGLLQMAADTKAPAEEDKAALFRCIYVDPQTRRVIGVGHKEDYTFYRDGQEARKTDEDIEKEIEKYHSDINDCLKKVRTSMKDLRKKAESLDPRIVGELLLDLRCLTKHVAFEEEQECRIVKVKNYITDEDVHHTDDYCQLYMDYLPLAGHVKEVYFAPHCDNMFVYEAELKRKHKDIKSIRSTHPLA